jgi:hypothetical protein
MGYGKLMEVEVISDRYEERTGKIGELLLSFPAIAPHRGFKESLFLGKLDDWLLLGKAERAVQSLADARFGRRSILIRGVQVKRGSLLITLGVFVGAHRFLKDYPDFRKGFLLLAADLREAGDKVEREIFARPKSKTVDALSEIARTLQFGPIVAGFLTDEIGSWILEKLWLSVFRGSTRALAAGGLNTLGLGMTVVGGFVAGKLARRSPVVNGVAEGILAAFTWVNIFGSTSPTQPVWLLLLLCPASVLAAAGGALLASRTRAG